jgi:hypothetical protein
VQEAPGATSSVAFPQKPTEVEPRGPRFSGESAKRGGRYTSEVQEDELWLPKSRGRGNVAHGGRTSPQRKEVFLYPQKRPILRPRRMRSMRRG